MNELRMNFRNAAAFFWEYPLLWLPVLAADFCKSVFGYADSVLRYAVIVWSMPQSVFGGYGGSGVSLPVLPLLLGGLLERLANAFDLLCYLYAFAVLARVVPLVQRGRSPEPLFEAKLPRRLWPTFGWCALAWTVLPVGSVLGMLVPHASLEGALALALLMLLPVLYLLRPVLQRYVQVNAGTDLPLEGKRLAGLYFLAFAVLTSFAFDYGFSQFSQHDASLNQLARHALPWWMLTACISLASALPYAFAMIGFSLRDLPPGLFVYGTLHPDRAPAEIRDEAKQLVWRSEGSVAGRLQDLGEYPALFPSTAGQTVEGAVFFLPNGDETLLAAFDHYEGFDPASPEMSLFLRELRPVTFPDGHTERHWVYVYNRELPAVD